MGTGQMEIENKASNEESVIMKDVLVGRVRIEEVKVSEPKSFQPKGVSFSKATNTDSRNGKDEKRNINIPVTPLVSVPDKVKVSSSGDASPHRQVLAAGTTKSPQSNQAAAMTIDQARFCSA